MDKIPNSRKAKHHLKCRLRREGVKIIAKHGRLFIVDKSARFACTRYYGWTAVREGHEAIPRLIEEHLQPIPHHSLWGLS